MGPLVGDNFVRFISGGALAITRALVATREIELDQSEDTSCTSVSQEKERLFDYHDYMDRSVTM